MNMRRNLKSYLSLSAVAIAIFASYQQLKHSNVATSAMVEHEEVVEVVVVDVVHTKPPQCKSPIASGTSLYAHQKLPSGGGGS